MNSSITWNSGNSLTLGAYRNIAVDANITNTVGAAVILAADNTGTGVGTVSFGNGAQVSTTGPVSILYNPSVNPGSSVVNNTSYVNPTENFTGDVTGGGALTAYMLVNTVYDLQNIKNNLSGTYALGTNIDASVTASWNGGFVPIGLSFGQGIGGGAGGSLNPFTGILEGNGYTVDQLTISHCTLFCGGPFDDYEFIGLVSYLGASGIVRNLGLTNLFVSAGSLLDGGLVGLSAGTIFNSYTTGSINVGTGGFEGGLVAENGGSITQSYSTMSVTGNQPYVGGLVGENDGGGSIVRSYATGAVTSNFSEGEAVGGLVGTNAGLILDSYATGAASGGGTAQPCSCVGIGGLAGDNLFGGTITQSYATGPVTGGPNEFIGGLVGYHIQDFVTGSYWDTYSTGQKYAYGDNTSVGATAVTSDPSQSGTANYSFKQSAYSNFDFSNTWGINPAINNGYPFLLWQLPSGTQAVAGYVYSGNGSPISGVTVADVVNGVSVPSLSTGGAVTSGANGYYDFLLPSGTISASGSQVLIYTTGGAAFQQNATGSVYNLNIYESYLNLTSGAGTLSSVSAGLSSAIGSNAAVQALINGLANQQINATGASFTIDQPINMPAGTLTLNANGAITATAAIDVDTFTLAAGNWTQVASPLPDFTAQNFSITGGSFLRALGGNGSSGSPYQIADIYGLQGIGSSPGLLANDYVLANNIDASPAASWNGGTGFVPIGSSAPSFNGVFDGQGNTIRGLTVSLPSSNYVGLFGYVGTGGIVENLGLLGGTVSGYSFVGALIGYNEGTVVNVYATGAVNGIGAVGGLVGENGDEPLTGAATITNSYATGAVTGIDFVGGLVGSNANGTIDGSYSTGSVTGANANTGYRGEC